MKRWLVNGVPAANVNPFDRGLTYGDGLFETISVRDGMCRFFGAHYARLVISCRRLLLPVPEQDALSAYAAEVIAGDPDGTLKIIVTRGPGERGYRLPAAAEPSCIVGFTPETVPVSPEAGVKARICETILGSNPRLAGIKSLNRLEQVLARAEWDDEDIAEGLMLNAAGDAICGTMSNLFAVAEGQLWTPVLDECGVHGIMRAQVMDLAEELGIACSEVRLQPATLADADDLFVTNSRLGLLPLASLEGQAYTRSPLTLRLRAGLADRGVTECA